MFDVYFHLLVDNLFHYSWHQIGLRSIPMEPTASLIKHQVMFHGHLYGLL